MPVKFNTKNVNECYFMYIELIRCGYWFDVIVKYMALYSLIRYACMGSITVK